MDIILFGITYGSICIVVVAILSYRIIKNPDGERFTYKKVLR
jgi:hypothetical protein